MRILTVVLSIQGADGRPGELLAGGGDGHLSESDANRVSMGRDAGGQGSRGTGQGAIGAAKPQVRLRARVSMCC